jgi:hypothetical protein
MRSFSRTFGQAPKQEGFDGGVATRSTNRPDVARVLHEREVVGMVTHARFRHVRMSLIVEAQSDEPRRMRCGRQPQAERPKSTAVRFAPTSCLGRRHASNGQRPITSDADLSLFDRRLRSRITASYGEPPPRATLVRSLPSTKRFVSLRVRFIHESRGARACRCKRAQDIHTRRRLRWLAQSGLAHMLTSSSMTLRRCLSHATILASFERSDAHARPMNIVIA